MHLQQRHFTSIHTVRGNSPEEPELWLCLLCFSKRLNTDRWTSTHFCQLKIFNQRHRIKLEMEVTEVWQAFSRGVSGWWPGNMPLADNKLSDDVNGKWCGEISCVNTVWWRKIDWHQCKQRPPEVTGPNHPTAKLLLSQCWLITCTVSSVLGFMIYCLVQRLDIVKLPRAHTA